jgi:copper(I)-binding protein
MHETMMSGSISSMRSLHRIPVRDGEMLRLVSGGRHLMLYDVDPNVRPGGEIVFTLHFEHGPPERLAALVVSASGEAH